MEVKKKRKKIIEPILLPLPLHNCKSTIGGRLTFFHLLVLLQTKQNKKKKISPSTFNILERENHSPLGGPCKSISPSKSSMFQSFCSSKVICERPPRKKSGSVKVSASERLNHLQITIYSFFSPNFSIKVF